MFKFQKSIEWLKVLQWLVVGIPVIFVIAVGTAFADTVVGQPVVTNSTPTATVFGIDSSVLNTNGKVRLEWLSTKPAKVHGCVKVKSFAKRGNATCIILPVGTSFTNSGRDRNGVFHTFGDHVKKGDDKFYKGADGKWRKVSCKNLTPAGKPELKASQVVLVKSFKDATYDVTVNLGVKNDIYALASCQTTGSSASATLTGSGTAAASATIRIRTKYSATAKTLATQQLSQSFKDSVSAQATAAAVVDLKGKATAMCSQSTPTPPVTPPAQTPIPLVDISGSLHECFVNDHCWVFVKVKAAPGHTATLDLMVSDGNIAGKVPWTTYDNAPCPSGWDCYRAEYWAPSYEVSNVYLDGIATQDDGQFGFSEVSFAVIKDDFGPNG